MSDLILIVVQPGKASRLRSLGGEVSLTASLSPLTMEEMNSLVRLGLLLGIPFISYLQMGPLYCFSCKLSPFLQMRLFGRSVGLGKGERGRGARGERVISIQHK